MFILERILPLFSSILILLDFELTLLKPTLIYEWVGISFIIIFLTVFQFSDHNLKKKDFWDFLIIPIFLIFASFLFLLFLETNPFKQLLVIFSGFLFWLFMESLFTFHRRSILHQAYSLQNISNYINLFTAFLLYCSFFALRIFLFYPVWLLAIFATVSTFILSFQNFWVNKIEFKRCAFFLLITPLIFSELFICIYYLPTSYLVNGLILTMVFYVLINLSRIAMLGKIENKIISRYLTIALFVIILILVTAQWK